jgi:hypothetical protein
MITSDIKRWSRLVSTQDSWSQSDVNTQSIE